MIPLTTLKPRKRLYSHFDLYGIQLNNLHAEFVELGKACQRLPGNIDFCDIRQHFLNILCRCKNNSNSW